MTAMPVTIAMLGYDGVQTLDLAGPIDAFSSANALHPGAYAVVTTSLEAAPFASEAGLRITPTCRLADAGPIDTLIVPGGEGLRRPGVAAQVATAVGARAASTRRIVSICTGIYGVAPSGLLDQRRATTHWRHAEDVAARFPAIRLDPDAIFVRDGSIYTSAGITAAIDLALALIEEDYGPRLALAVARDLVVYLRRSGGQRQYSELLRFQGRAGDRFADLAAWITAHLADDLSVEALASRSALSPRQFSRRFAQAFGMAPAQQIEALRLHAACDQLTATRASMDAIAAAVGFRSEDAFRRAFDRRFGIPPTEYRARFASTTAAFNGDPHVDLKTA
jgi:transcriptional regulator GlxA family with amidase domain